MPSAHTTRAYVGAVNRLIRSAEIIANLTGRPPCPLDLRLALIVRTQGVSKNTTQVEIYGLRWVVRDQAEKGEAFQWHPAIQTPPWLRDMNASQWEELRAASTISMSVARSEGPEVITRLFSQIQAHGLHGEITQAELVDQIGCFATDQGRKANQKDQGTITSREMTVVDMTLAQSDPQKAIYMLARGETDIAGLTRIFTNVIWATGMRPAEVWGCALLVPRQDIDLTPEMIETITRNPEGAIRARLLTPVERAPRSPSESLGSAAMAAIRQTGAPALLVIPNAKQTNANEHLRSPVRIQILDGIPRHTLNMIATASQLRGLVISEGRQESIRKMINYEIRKINDRELAFHGRHITLYSFRHAFATRVKRIHGMAEVAALTGHSSASSVYRYGRRRDQQWNKKAGSWLPQADPERVALVEAKWKLEATPKLAPTPS